MRDKIDYVTTFYQNILVNTIPDDVLSPCITKTSAGMILIELHMYCMQVMHVMHALLSSLGVKLNNVYAFNVKKI